MIQVFENEFNKIELHFTTISKISLYHRFKKLKKRIATGSVAILNQNQ